MPYRCHEQERGASADSAEAIRIREQEGIIAQLQQQLRDAAAAQAAAPAPVPTPAAKVTPTWRVAAATKNAAGVQKPVIRADCVRSAAPLRASSTASSAADDDEVPVDEFGKPLGIVQRMALKYQRQAEQAIQRQTRK